MNGALAVSRYTLVELSRRRILLVFFVIGALGIAAIGGALKIIATVVPNAGSFGAPGSAPPDPAKVSRLLELEFVTQLIGVVGFFALLIAFAIGMTAIYHDLESGAAVAIFSKPVSRLAFTAGKILAALSAMVVIVGLLGLETRLVMTLFGGGLEGALWVETVAAVANASLLMLIVLALSTWMNNIIAAVVAFVYNAVASIVVALHAQLTGGGLGDNATVRTLLDIAYWLVPHHLMSDAQRQLVLAEVALFPPSDQGGTSTADILSSVPGASSVGDFVWWVFLVVLMAALVYAAVRRRQVSKVAAGKSLIRGAGVSTRKGLGRGSRTWQRHARSTRRVSKAARAAARRPGPGAPRPGRWPVCRPTASPGGDRGRKRGCPQRSRRALPAQRQARPGSTPGRRPPRSVR